MPETDRDILIEVRTKVEAIHRDMTQPEGRVPKLEKTVESHSEQINRATGAFSVAVWIVGAILLLLSGGLAAHVFGGK